MPSLREQVKKTLARTEPGEREARDELQTILAKSRGEIRPWWRAPVIALTLGVAVAVAVVFFIRTKPSPAPVATTPPAIPVDQDIHLYLHVEGEPLDKALTLDLRTKGK